MTLLTRLQFLFIIVITLFCIVNLTNGRPQTESEDFTELEEYLSIENSGGNEGNGLRIRRQAEGGGAEPGNCEFGTTDDVNLCDWMNVNGTQLKFEGSLGMKSYYLGGPTTDVTFEDDLGGYARVETSAVSNSRPSGSGYASPALLQSSTRIPTGAEGICLQFWYAIAGLSANRLSVLLHPMEEMMDDQDTSGFVDSSFVYDGSDDTLLWVERDKTQGDWKLGSILYTYNQNHTIVFEATPMNDNDIGRIVRGYIAIDDVSFSTTTGCNGFCTFEKDICDWEQGVGDFEWTMSRGSQSLASGPLRDRYSSSSPDQLTGGYLYINSGYPRTPGDTARLISTEFSATDPDTPLCMRFWAHMYGNGIGALRVILRNTEDSIDEVLWELKGEVGNNWYQGQVPIASTKLFKIVIEGVVGMTNLGDIAIDDISIIQSACPSAPQEASIGVMGDCTFQLDECGWTNPSSRLRIDEADWVRTVANDVNAPAADHTLGTSDGYFMALPWGNSVKRGGDRAYLVSDLIPGSDQTWCISFWYFMFENFISQTGPSLGSLSVQIQTTNDTTKVMTTTPIWMLQNHQGTNWLYGQAKIQSFLNFTVIFEGMWGSSRGSNGMTAIDDITFYKGDCSIKPAKAVVTASDCSFQRGTCLWTNTTTDQQYRYTLASVSSRPSSLSDHTFGGPVGFTYFDVFNQKGKSQILKLISPKMNATEDRSDVCLSFWYATFGRLDSTILSITRQEIPQTVDAVPGDPVDVWNLTAANDMDGNGIGRPSWEYGQVSIAGNTDFIMSFLGNASNGGYALDDIRILPGTCNIRPKDAEPNSDNGNSGGGGSEP